MSDKINNNNNNNNSILFEVWKILGAQKYAPDRSLFLVVARSFVVLAARYEDAFGRCWLTFQNQSGLDFPVHFLYEERAPICLVSLLYQKIPGLLPHLFLIDFPKIFPAHTLTLFLGDLILLH